MPVDIPGFFYDPEKKRYFKIASNSNNVNNRYTSSSLKHERDEVEMKEKISKLKIQKHARSNLPFVLSDALGIRNMLRFKTRDSEISDYYYYKLESLQSKEIWSRKLGSNSYQPSSSDIPIRRILRYNDDLIIGKDSYMQIYRADDLRENQLSGDRIDPHMDNYEHYLNHSILRNMEVFKANMLVRTWCGLMNEPSIIQVMQGFDVKYSNDFPNESINNSKCVENKIFSCGDKRLNVIDLNRYDLIDNVKSKGDCLCLDFGDDNSRFPNELYLGYRNSTIKMWDLRTKKFSNVNKLKNFNPIINISKVNQFDLICSSIGSLGSNSLNLYDVRMGFKKPKLIFQSNKSLSNVFGETFQLVRGLANDSREFFMLQNADLIEFFRISDPAPFKTISKFDIPKKENSLNQPTFEGSFYDSEKIELYTTSCTRLMIYK